MKISSACENLSIYSIEIRPPRLGEGFKGNFYDYLTDARRSGYNTVNVVDKRGRMSPLELYEKIDCDEISWVLHVGCFDRSARYLEKVLNDIKESGAENVLVVGGDVKNGEHRHVFASEAIKMASKIGLNVGCCFDQYSENREFEVERLQRKVESGARFIYTQPIFTPEDIENLEGLYGFGLPVVVGVMLFEDVEGVKKARELLSIPVPQKVENTVKESGSNVEIVWEIREEIEKNYRGEISGLYVTPFGKPFGRAYRHALNVWRN